LNRYKYFFIFYVVLLLFVHPLLSQQYSIEQYLNIRGAVSPKYSYNSGKIYFQANVTGTSQIWSVNKPGEEPVQVTNFKERITGYSPNPVNDIILAQSDEGGSEYSQFYLMSGNGADVKMITDGAPKVIYGFGRWSDDGSFFTYFSNKRSPYFYDIYVYSLETGVSEMVFSSDHTNYPSVISSDGSKLVITRSYSTYDNDIYLFDLVTKQIELISIHDNFNEPAEFNASSFDAAGENLYFTSNNKSDLFRIGIYNIKDSSVVYPGYDFLENYKNREVSRLVFSRDKSKMLVQVNDEGYDRIFMYDLNNTKEIPIPKNLRTLSITAVSFSNTGSKVIIGVNSAANPSILYQWDYITGIIEQVTKPNLAGIDLKTFIEPKLISYTSYDGLVIPAFIYRPANTSGKKMPCIIAIHGGPEGQATYGFAPIYQYLLSAGYIIVEPNVRGSTGYGKVYESLDNVRNRENSVKDIASLVDHLNSFDYIDPGKIAVYGGSYGGYMVLACLTLYPQLFAAGVDVVGISNFITFLQNTGDYRKNNRATEYGSLENDREFLENISPLGRVNNIAAPLMIIHGRNDPRVPVGEAEQMYGAIIKNGGIAELHIYEDEGHGIAKQKNRLDIYPKIVKFLDKNVKDK
jgi:dipeptidyl aminopeptidase/acylaminoacyl peptidase